MCGIVGIWAKNKKGVEELSKIDSATSSLSHRGPDNQGIKSYSNFAFGHRRLSIIDISDTANQPMIDETGRYSIVFNGEIYNYHEIKQKLELEGFRFKTKSDTEVLLNLLISKGEKGLDLLNGFFAFIFYDKEENTVLFARDRMGIKPLTIYEDEDKIVLSSEMNSIFDFDVDRTLNETALNLFLRLTYTPAPESILKHAYKILPGQYGKITEQGLELKRYYTVKRQSFFRKGFSEACDELRSILTQSVTDRLVADVPLGSFLSGGLDSSIVASIAKRKKDDLETFSVGFDHPYFNESSYAKSVAAHIGSNHHEIILGKEDFREHFDSFLNSIDEPFADSSAFASYILSKETKKHMTVALSGDGADELFGGYRKHRAELAIREMSSSKERLIKVVSALFKEGKSSRSDKIGEFNRKVQKLAKGINLSNEERYFEWCCFNSKEDVFDLLEPSLRESVEWRGVTTDTMNDVLIADQQLVLPNDMLKKVDLSSMANSLEVRTPFLDHRVVEFANSLPLKYKINGNVGKMILKESFKDYLPKDIIHRRKKGFEIPLEDWLFDSIKDIFNSPIFQKDYILDQKIFDYDYVQVLRKELGSRNYGDKIYLLWSIVIFQHWYNRFIYNDQST